MNNIRKTATYMIVGFIALFLGASLTRNIFSYKDKVQFYQDLKAEHEAESARNKKLKSEIGRSSDYYYIERQIRDKLNLLKEDEISLIIPEITPAPTPVAVVAKKPHEQWADLVLRKSF